MGFRVGNGLGGGADLKMNTNGQNGQYLSSVQARLAARGPEGVFLPLVAGQESLEELRQMVIEFCHVCPAKQIHLECPFRIMGTLAHDSLAALVNSLTREACVNLFQLELECRSKYGAQCALKSQEGR